MISKSCRDCGRASGDSLLSVTDDVQIVSRIRSSRVKLSSCILILRIVKKELSCTGVVPATEPPMPKLE